MKNKAIWVVLCALVVFTLVMVSCSNTTTSTTASAPTTSTAPTTSAATTSAPGTTAVTLTKLDGTTVTKQLQAPQYGGTLNVTTNMDAAGWDPLVIHSLGTLEGLSTTMEELGNADFTRGPAGTDEMPWSIVGISDPFPKEVTGCLAQSWKQVDPTTYTVTLHQGMHWQNKAPANGREIVSDDVVACINRLMTSPQADKFIVQYITSVTATDKYTITFKLNSTQPDFVKNLLTYRGLFIYPHEIIDQNIDLSKWQNVVGSGPFILNNVESGNVFTFTKNPDYWGNDPFFPKNKLPYIDAINMYIIPDTSAQEAALRTGKIDQLNTVAWQDAASIIQTNPDLKNVKKVNYLSDCFVDFITNPGHPPGAPAAGPFLRHTSSAGPVHGYQP